MSAEELTLETFAPYVARTFMVSTEEDSFEAELIEASPMGTTRGPTGRQAFSLVLRGPRSEAPRQGVYRVAHGELGTLEIFMVPIGPDDKGMKYEAVFT